MAWGTRLKTSKRIYIYIFPAEIPDLDSSTYRSHKNLKINMPPTESHSLLLRADFVTSVCALSPENETTSNPVIQVRNGGVIFDSSFSIHTSILPLNHSLIWTRFSFSTVNLLANPYRLSSGYFSSFLTSHSCPVLQTPNLTSMSLDNFIFKVERRGSYSTV